MSNSDYVNASLKAEGEIIVRVKTGSKGDVSIKLTLDTFLAAALLDLNPDVTNLSDENTEIFGNAIIKSLLSSINIAWHDELAPAWESAASLDFEEFKYLEGIEEEILEHYYGQSKRIDHAHMKSYISHNKKAVNTLIASFDETNIEKLRQHWLNMPKKTKNEKIRILNDLELLKNKWLYFKVNDNVKTLEKGELLKKLYDDIEL